MRESRSSGSVEGVISDGHSYSDEGLSLPGENVRNCEDMRNSVY